MLDIGIGAPSRERRRTASLVVGGARVITSSLGRGVKRAHKAPERCVAVKAAQGRQRPHLHA